MTLHCARHGHVSVRFPAYHARRLELGLSQERLALDADIDRTFVSQIERGIGNPSLRILSQLDGQLDSEVAALLVSAPKSRRR